MFKKIQIFVALCLCLASTKQTQACVFTDYKNVYLFGINLLSNPAYKNYFYNAPYAEDACYPGNEKNISEWQKLYPQIKNLDDFHGFIYRTDLQEVQKTYIALEGGANPFPQNEFVKLLLANKEKETLAYLLFSKKCEGFVTQRYYTWENEQKPKANEGNAAAILLEEGKKLLENTQNAFFKQRYAFQLVRLAFYQLPNKQATVDLFDKIAANGEQNYIYYRTLLHKGFALKTLNRNAEANLLFAEVFNKESDLRCVAFRNLAIYKNNKNYEGIDETQWNETINKATNPDLKAALYLLRSSSEFKLNPAFLASSLQNGASVEQLEILLLRQLKSAETELFLPNLQQTTALDSAALTFGDAVADSGTPTEEKGFFGKIWTSIVQFFKNLFGATSQKHKKNEVLYGQIYGSDNTVPALRDITENQQLKDLEAASLAIAEKYTDKAAIFYLGAAYCQVMRQKFGLANDNLANARKTANNQQLTEQVLFLETLAKVLQAEIIDEKVEEMLAQNSKMLWTNATLRTDNKTWQRLIIFSELGRKYLKQNELSKAILAFKYCKQQDVANILLDFYCSQTELENYLTFIKSNPDTEFKKLLLADLQQTEEEKIGVVKDIQATKLAREGKFVAALAKLKEINPTYWAATARGATTVVNPKDTTFVPNATAFGSVMLGVAENTDFSESFTTECQKITTSFGVMPMNEQPKLEVYENKLKFLEKLVELQQKAENSKGDEAAKLYMEMANGMYHSPFWLYNNSLWACGGMLDAMRSANPIAYPFNISTNFSTQFHNRKMHLVRNYCVPYLAADYYKKALQTATDKNLKAQGLLFQAAAMNNLLASYWESGIKLDSKSALQVLTQDYADTPFAKQAEYCLGAGM
jgi:hypothetical protein